MRRYVLAVLVCCIALLVPSAAWATPEADPGPDASARVVELTNAERAAAGLAPLTASPHLGDAAHAYAAILAGGDCFAHTCGPVPALADRSERAGYTGWTSLGENLAAGQPSPEEVVREWMASPGHRANILDPDFAEIGVATATGGPYGIYWVQALGARTR